APTQSPDSQPAGGATRMSSFQSSFQRRDFLRGLAALGGVSSFPVAASACLGANEDEAPTLVLLQLTGGNDGLSMISPHGDDDYHRARPSLARRADDLLPIDDYRGFHPALERLRAQYAEGDLALIEGVGYPNPIRSHFKSYDVWHAADLRGRSIAEGWVGRVLREGCPVEDRTPELVVHVGKEPPISLHSAETPPIAFRTAAGYRWVDGEAGEGGEDVMRRSSDDADEAPKRGREARLERLSGLLRDAHQSSGRVREAVAAYKPKSKYPQGGFGDALRTIAALVDARLGTRVASVELGGFDTHSSQKNRHDNLMRSLDQGVAAFLSDLRARGHEKRVVVMVFSEFGRRVKENASRGTDHGTAGPMMVFGSGVKGGLYGAHPSLTDLDQGDLRFTTDFRSVYSASVDRCFGAGLGKRVIGFDPLKKLFA
ncbi:MAG: DUF1501 domain-containing protein, partial [Planctomycetota bacterium]